MQQMVLTMEPEKRSTGLRTRTKSIETFKINQHIYINVFFSNTVVSNEGQLSTFLLSVISKLSIAASRWIYLILLFVISKQIRQ